jgi:hypothetical protein
MDLEKLDDRTAFKLGFLTRCLEEDLTGDALQARIKAASGGWLDALANTAMAPAAVGGALGLAGGGLLGYGAAKLTEQPAPDPEAAKIKELEQAYKIQAARMRARRAMKQYRSAR